MSSPEPFPPGSFCWVDLATTDPEAAVAFYGPLFGWQATPPAGDAQAYRVLRKDGHDIGGLLALEPSQAGLPRWQSWLAVPDVDVAAKQARALGAEVLTAPLDAGEAGRTAYLRDPGGATLALRQAPAHPGAQLVNAIGAPCWHELHTRTVEASVDFYAALCGWRHRISSSVPGGQYRLFSDADGAKRGGLMPIGDDWEAYGGPVTPSWAVYFGVADCDATAEQAQALGGGLKYPIMELPRIGRFAALTDPQGATFWVIQLAEDHD